MKHFPDPEVLRNRIIYYKNSTQFRDVTDKFNVTHIVDYRPGYIRKALIRPEYLSRAYLLQPNKPQKHQNHDLITHVSDWDALITSLQQKNTTDTEQHSVSRFSHPVWAAALPDPAEVPRRRGHHQPPDVLRRGPRAGVQRPAEARRPI